MRMEVPCCGGIEAAAKNALKASGKFIPWRVVTAFPSTEKYEAIAERSGFPNFMGTVFSSPFFPSGQCFADLL